MNNSGKIQGPFLDNSKVKGLISLKTDLRGMFSGGKALSSKCEKAGSFAARSHELSG